MVGLKEIIIGFLIVFFLFYKDISDYYQKWKGIRGDKGIHNGKDKGIDNGKDIHIGRGDSKRVDIKTHKSIPKVVYKTGIDDYNNLHRSVKNVFSKTIKDNPGFKINYYSNKDSRDFIKNNFSNVTLITYDKLIPGAYKADLFRYCILYKNGGIYSDLTQRFMKPFDEFIDFKNDNLYLVKDIPQNNHNGVQISFMASRPGNEIFRNAIAMVIKNVNDKYYGQNPLHPTGPALFYKILQEYNGKYKMELKETGIKVVDKNNETIIMNKINNHQSVILRNQEHYSTLWANNRIYKR